MELLGDVGQVEGRSNSLGDSVNLGKIGARIAPNVPCAWKSFWVYPLELLGNEGQMEARFSPFRGSINLDTRKVHGLRQMYHRLRNLFGCT
jgi:hypothetical protein